MRYEPPDFEYGLGGRQPRSCDNVLANAKRNSRRRRLSSSDRLRLDVAVKHDLPDLEDEMYSWVGEDRFGGRDLFDLVRDGAVSTGSFSSMLASVFGNDTARFSYNGDSNHGGRLLSEFGFRIPQEKSKYMYVFGSGANGQTPMAYDGELFVDPQASDLVRVIIRTGQLPPETGACEVQQTLAYGHVRINGAEFLLPTEAHVSVIHPDGTEAENRIQYSACHEFVGRATVRFDQSGDGARAGTEGVTPVAALVLPAGLPFKVVLTDTIDTVRAAAGDPIKGRLKTAIHDRTNQVLVAEGTPVTGRILSIRRFYESSQPNMSKTSGSRQHRPPLVVEIRLEAVDLNGTSHPFNAAFDTGLQRFAKLAGPFTRDEIGPLDRSNDPARARFEFWDAGPNYVIKSGLESSWKTLAP
jgi:hypothetical protein